MDESRLTADPLRNIRSYNDEMTISQVIRYFERQGIFFTKPMIQGYVRAGVIPQPKDKRYYTRPHMVLLALAENLKRGFSAEEIKRLFETLEAYPGALDGASDEALAIYGEYAARTRDIFAALNELSEEIAAGAGEYGEFLTPAALMTGSVILREAAEKMLERRRDTNTGSWIKDEPGN
ncbi:MAG: DUF1836 domain-containing protein [Defluviitaleaceae bacterium]|nr:DUF1836 domain-containing protein [Defluviitaleaceae bacterium]